jgi:hypothetical protein
LRGTRELVVSGSPFIAVYHVRLDLVQVLRVWSLTPLISMP